MNECKPLPGARTWGTRVMRARVQGLSLVHFSAQHQPFLTLKAFPKSLNTPSNPAINTLYS